MKVSVDDQELFTLTETQKQVIKNDIPSDIFDDDMKRRLNWVLNHKYERCLMRLKQEWIPKLKDANVKSIPLDDDEFAQLVFSQPEYKDRKSRELTSQV
jgi:hypothetical protein